MENLASINELSLVNLVNGIILFIENHKFSEQQLYKFFYDLASENKPLASRLCFKGSPGELRSEPLRRIITFREMGKLLEVHMPNPVEQAYHPRTSQLESLRQDMQEMDILPHYESELKELATEFVKSLH